MIDVNINDQSLTCWRDGRVAFQCAVSTASNGVGNRNNSFATPLGYHRVRAKVGAGLDRGAVIKGRRPTGEIIDPARFNQSAKEDLIVGRILWLSGLNTAFNRGGSVDTMRRYIYIHGTPYTETIGVPNSHGCIRLAPEDMVRVFDFADVGEQVYIGINGLPL